MKEVIKPKVKKTFSEKVDSIVGVFSPRKELERKHFRESSKKAFSSYHGAENTRLRQNWISTAGSADEDLLDDLPTLRERSRDQVRNNGIASGIISTAESNIVGSGIIPQSRVLHERIGMSKEQASEFQKAAEYAFNLWSKNADSGNKMDFYEMQSLVVSQVWINGDVSAIPLMVDEPNRKFKRAIEIIEADRLETPFGMKSNKDIRSGVRLGKRSQAVEYFINTKHPGDMTLGRLANRKYKSYKPFDSEGRSTFMHLFRTRRPGQTRGEPKFAPVLNLFKDLDDYMESEVVAARIAACFSIFIKKEDPMSAAGGRSYGSQNDQRLESLEPGRIDYLSEGESIESFNPNRPGITFDPFVMRLLRMLSSGIGLPYEVVAKDFSQVNYSSARAALLDAYRFFKAWQKWLTTRFCQPVWELVMEEAFLLGMLPINNFYEFKDEYCRVMWMPQGWDWVDPLKEAKAATEAMKSGILSLSDVLSAKGSNWEDVLEQRAIEEAKRKELGLTTPEEDKLKADEAENKRKEEEKSSKEDSDEEEPGDKKDNKKEVKDDE